MNEGRLDLHAGHVLVDGLGFLITGAAGSGKSALAVSLLRGATREGREAVLVADDRVIVERQGDRLLGRAPEPILGLIELSGIGILRLPVARQGAIDVLVELSEAPERLPEPEWADRLGVALRRVTLPARQAPFGADLLLTWAYAGKDSILPT